MAGLEYVANNGRSKPNMNKTPYISLQPSEGIIAQAAASIYAAYVTAGRVEEGKEDEWIRRATREAISIAKLADESVRSDEEMT